MVTPTTGTIDTIDELTPIQSNSTATWASTPPYRPGLIHDKEYGAAIEIEIWFVPREQFGNFVAQNPAPLGIGEFETANGRLLPGFICENHAIGCAKDITELGGWR